MIFIKILRILFKIKYKAWLKIEREREREKIKKNKLWLFIHYYVEIKLFVLFNYTHYDTQTIGFNVDKF